MKSRALYWLKRDFRLKDNPALTAALAAYDEVVLCFVLEPTALAAPETSELHIHAQCDAYNGLTLHLRPRLIKLGSITEDVVSPIGFSHKEAVETFDLLHKAESFTHLVSHVETGGNRTFDRDKAVAVWCKANNVVWQERRQTGVIRGKINRDTRHKNWESFYYKSALPIPGQLDKITIPAAYIELLKVPAPLNIDPGPKFEANDIWKHRPALFGEAISGPLQPEHFGFSLTPEQRRYVQPVNEAAAGVTLNSFLHERGIGFSKGMSSPNSAFYRGSRLSVHLAWGTITGRQVFQATNARAVKLQNSEDKDAVYWRRNLRSFLSRIYWRDHFIQRLETEVEMEHRPLNPNFWDIQLENDPMKLEAWINGRTGYPMVDACLRCLAVTGYINFRMRAMITSTATNMLHLDFRQIDKHMARFYTDYDPGIHLSQLQMQAGMVGINILRVYSPEKQIADQDPKCNFIRRWIPELRPFSATEIIGRDLTKGLGDYPPAIVDRAEKVKEYWDILKMFKLEPDGKVNTKKVLAKHGSRRNRKKVKKIKKEKVSAQLKLF
jgi:deoxyribodipyrimidine photo-lyase